MKSFIRLAICSVFVAAVLLTVAPAKAQGSISSYSATCSSLTVTFVNDGSTSTIELEATFPVGPTAEQDSLPVNTGLGATTVLTLNFTPQPVGTFIKYSADDGDSANEEDLLFVPVGCTNPANAVTWCATQLNADGRIDPRCNDRVVIYCNPATQSKPASISVWGIDTSSKGHFLSTFNVSDLLKAGAKGLQSSTQYGSIAAASLSPGTFFASWNGGPWGANGQGDFVKQVSCKI